MATWPISLRLDANDADPGQVEHVNRPDHGGHHDEGGQCERGDRVRKRRRSDSTLIRRAFFNRRLLEFGPLRREPSRVEPARDIQRPVVENLSLHAPLAVIPQLAGVHAVCSGLLA